MKTEDFFSMPTTEALISSLEEGELFFDQDTIEWYLVLSSPEITRRDLVIFEVEQMTSEYSVPLRKCTLLREDRMVPVVEPWHRYLERLNFRRFYWEQMAALTPEWSDFQKAALWRGNLYNALYEEALTHRPTAIGIAD